MLPGLIPFLGGGLTVGLTGNLTASANSAAYDFPLAVTSSIAGGQAPFTYVWSFQPDIPDMGAVTFPTGQGTSSATVRVSLVAPGTTLAGWVILTVTDNSGAVATGSTRLLYTNTTPP